MASWVAVAANIASDAVRKPMVMRLIGVKFMLARERKG